LIYHFGKLKINRSKLVCSEMIDQRGFPSFSVFSSIWDVSKTAAVDDHYLSEKLTDQSSCEGHLSENFSSSNIFNQKRPIDHAIPSD
jgi:hypothetical protein